MKKYFAVAMLLLVSLATIAQKTTVVLSDGAQLLFKDTKSKLTNDEKNWFFKKMNFNLSKDKKQFISDEIEVGVQLFVTDINKDAVEEVFIIVQSVALFGNTGQGFSLFIKSNAGKFELHDEIGGGIAMIITSKKTGYPDIAIGGPGFKFPAYRWDGKKYKYFKEIKDADLQSNKIKYLHPDECSKLYTDTLK